MAKLQSTVLPAACSDEWLAKTYSEYLYACAEDQIDINNDISAACDDDTLDGIIEGYRSIWDDNIGVVNDALSAYAISKGVLKDDIQNRTQAFKDALSDYSPDVTVQSALTNITNKYNDTWSEGSDLLEDLINEPLDSDSALEEQDDIISRVNSIVNELFVNHNLPEGYKYPLQEGFVDFKDMVKGLIKFTSINSDSSSTLDLDAVGSQDSSIGTISVLASTIITQMKDAAASNIAWAQGFASCTFDNLTDRITNFTESVKTAFSSAYTEAKESFNNVRAMLSSAQCNVRNFIEQAGEQLGWTQLINSNKVINETDVSQYTGASPYSGIDLHTAKGLATATARTVVAAGYAVWQGMKKIGLKIWGKIRPYVKAITTDPEDIKVIDKDATSYQFNNWSYNTNNACILLKFNRETALALATLINSKYAGKTIAMDNFFGSMVFTLKNGAYADSSGNLSVYYGYQFKPKAINYKSAIDCGVLSTTTDGHDYGITIADNSDFITISNLVNKLKSFTSSEDMYMNDDSSEEEFMTGVFAGIISSMTVAFGQLAEFRTQVDAYNSWDGTVTIAKDQTVNNWTYDFSNTSDWTGIAVRWIIQTDSSWKYIHNITNKDALEIVSGYNDVNQTNWNDYNQGVNRKPYDGVGQFQCFKSYFQNTDMAELVGLYLSFFILQLNDRRNNPGDFLYVPYTTDTYDFAAPRYAIKTDAENANIVDIFLSAITIVVVVAITVIIGAKIARTIKKAKFKKWTAIKGELDNKIWTNGPLSSKEWRRYIRADRKLSKINLWSTGTAASNVISSTRESSSLSSLLPYNQDNNIITDDHYDVSIINKVLRSIVG